MSYGQDQRASGGKDLRLRAKRRGPRPAGSRVRDCRMPVPDTLPGQRPIRRGLAEVAAAVWIGRFHLCLRGGQFPGALPRGGGLELKPGRPDAAVRVGAENGLRLLATAALFAALRSAYLPTLTAG